MTLPSSPNTRKEMYLSNMAGQGTPLPEEPLTREEMYLDVIAKQGGGGGGTGDGDMKKSVYDNDLAVLSAGGIKSFVATQTEGKVDKVTGKGLSSNDYTDEEKTIVGGVTDALALKADKSEIPENTSDLTNDSGFITNTVNNLANYYLKTQTYSQSEVDALIAAVKNGRFISVATLPTTDIDTKAIYLVPSADPQTTNIKDEYINIDGTSAGWELIGSTAIDLSGYVTDTDLTTALAEYTTTAKLTTLLAAKQDTISDLATIRSGASAGATAYQKPQTGIPKADLASEVQSSLLINGSTVTPTDDIATWLKCADLHQSYTTLLQVLADSSVLSALMESLNAVDYLVRSTTWASTICANETAMNYIGKNNYCADILLGNSTWRTSICNSIYFEQVLNVKVPPMTGYTTPSGEVRAKSEYYPAWGAFNETSPIYWGSADGTEPSAGQWIEYKFPKAVKIYKVKLQNSSTSYTVTTFKIQGSNDGTNYTDITDNITNTDQTTQGITYYAIAPSESYQYYRFYVVAGKYSTYVSIQDIQYYGRSDLQPVDDRINTKADLTLIAPIQTTLTASKAYAVGEQFVYNQVLYKATQAIAQEAAITIGTNAGLAGDITSQIFGKVLKTKEQSDSPAINAPSSSFTAPDNGVLYGFINANDTSVFAVLYVNGNDTVSAGGTTNLPVVLFVKKGDVVTSRNIGLYYLRFSQLLY